MKQCGVIVGLIISLAILGAAAWYFDYLPMYLDQTVDDLLPCILNEATPAEEAKPVGMLYTLAQKERANRADRIAEPLTAGSMMLEVKAEATGEATEEATEEAIDKVAVAVVEDATANTPVIAGLGEFQNGDSFHRGAGRATLFQGSDGAYVLRFDDFAVTNGPDLHVLLSTNPAPTDHESLESYIDLGSLKGNSGSQNYMLPAGIDGAQFKSVVIYCLPFHVIFATATLN